MPFLEVRGRLGRELITVLELLGPANKRSGADREQYMAKREELLSSAVHFLEIDLLRGGRRMPLENGRTCDYSVLVSRAEERPRAGFWPIRLRQRLPIVPVPLQSKDPAGTALGSAQLDASAAIPGSFVYTPAAGTVLGSGSGQRLSVTFTPTDSADYESVVTSTTINVQTGKPLVVPVIIGEKAFFQRKLKHGKPTGPATLMGYELQFNTSLIMASAQNLANYRIGSTTKKKVKKRSTTVFTPIPRIHVAYDGVSDSVSLEFTGKETFKTGGELTVEASPPSGIESVSGAFMRANAVFTISKGGKIIKPQ